MELSRDQYRYFLKDAVRLAIDFRQTDQNRGVEPPPVQKPADEGKRIDLVRPGRWQGIAGGQILQNAKKAQKGRETLVRIEEGKCQH